ncbi:MAG: glycoside hydrolase family 4 [Actinomycetota bacterium]
MRLCVVGGGSAYMPGIAFALAHVHERLGESTIVLQDIDPDALELQRQLTQGILRSRGAGHVRVEAQADRLRAVEGCDVVLSAFRPGGFEARHLDESIAVAQGVIGQETAGPGGFAMALRSVPLVLELLEDVRTAASADCLVLNYTNPVQIVSEAVQMHAPDARFLGLCDQTAGEQAWLAGLLEIPAAAVELDTAGTNHMTFTRAVRVDGVDRTGEIWELLDTLSLEELPEAAQRRIVRLFRVLRHIPSEYLQYFAFHDEVLAEQRAAGRTRAQEVMEQLPGVRASYRREATAAHPSPSMARASEGHGDFAVSIAVAAMDGGAHRAILNLPNVGQVDQLPSGIIVETPAVITGGVATPLPQGRLPPEFAGTVLQVAEHARLAAEAAVSGDPRVAVRALVAHPLVRSPVLAEELVRAYLTAHASHLPRFAMSRPLP